MIAAAAAAGDLPAGVPAETAADAAAETAPAVTATAAAIGVEDFNIIM